jgi:serine/threonine protein kinase
MVTNDKVEELLSEYLAAREAGIPPILEDLCAGNADLLTEVRRRLAAVDAFGQLVTSAAGSSETTSYPAANPAKTSFPARIGAFSVLRKLGEGGMGSVLLAEDTNLKRQVAIKVIKAEVAAAPAAKERFLREARAVAAIRHDHVVPIYHVGEEEGQPYIVMPLLEGESLATQLLRGPLPPAKVIQIGREAALGLSAAHAVGVIHRDIKPANLWLDATTGRLLVLDFGLAQVSSDANGLTKPGMIQGTPCYMSPEQVDGKTLDARSDLFALGVVLYECSTGLRPFSGNLTGVLRAIAADHPTSPHEVNPTVPPRLSHLVMRLLAKAPADRPASADEVKEELALMTSPPGEKEANPDTIVSAHAKRRRKWLKGSAIGLAVLLSLFLVARLCNFPGLSTTGNQGDASGANIPTDGKPPIPSQSPGTSVFAPVHGSVDLLVYRIDGTGSERLVTLDDPLAMPLRKGDHFKIVADVDRASYLYLFWIDENGIGVPVYPWKPGQWGTRPEEEQPVTKLDRVATNGKAFRVTGDSNGMETILMFARSSKLEASENEIRGWFANLKPLPFRGIQARVWFENFDVLRKDTKRGFEIDGDVTAKDGPMGLQSTLEQRIGTKVEFSRAISFARIGAK